MGLSARVPTGADTAGFVPEIWSQLVLEAVHNQLVCWPVIDSRWQTDLKKGDTVNIGIINTVTATEVVVGTKASALDPATGSKLQLVINQWYEAPIDIDYMTIRQSQVEWGGQARRECAYAIAKRMDTSVNALFSALFGGTVFGADGQTLTDDILIAIKENLDEADVPLDDQRYLIVDPSALADMLKIDKFLSAEYGRQGVVQNGVIGKSPIYGCTVLVTNNLTATTTGAYAAMIHKRAIAGAAQMEPSWMKEFEELHLRRYASEALWGVLEVRDTFGQSFYTRKK